MLKRDETVSPDSVFRNSLPSLALRASCEPSVLYSSAEGGFVGFFAQRWPDGAWKSEQTPMRLAAGNLAIDPLDGAAIVAVYDGAYGVSLWRRSDGAWARVSELDGKHHLGPGQMVVDRSGVVHIAHVDSSLAAHHRTYDGAWHDHPVFPQAATRLSIDLSAADEPRIALWDRSGEGPIRVLWAAPPAAPEVAVAVNWNAIEARDFAMVVAPDDSSWLLTNGDLIDEARGDHTLVLAHRDADGAWSSEQLIAEETFVDTCGSAQPKGPGETCEHAGTTIQPAALLASIDEVRALYRWQRVEGEYISMCPPEHGCLWIPQQRTVRTEVRMAWPGSAPSEHITVIEDGDDPVSVQLDTAGNMHMALYHPTQQLGAIVRYLMIGP
ncbi:hypothetical protein [Nannocystis pusilla]|uniref:Uncharacterized protein n=1 Tax=Nannocystis pusilla TaxID=889268 RepID=A0ABS7TNU6_9BACT|nr:hypothetical protein [Nannocystis pusilla]MBZ5709902.1 hypothetical protein [Nannocystis pusilla]